MKIVDTECSRDWSKALRNCTGKSKGKQTTPFRRLIVKMPGIIDLVNISQYTNGMKVLFVPHLCVPEAVVHSKELKVAKMALITEQRVNLVMVASFKTRYSCFAGGVFSLARTIHYVHCTT